MNTIKQLLLTCIVFLFSLNTFGNDPDPYAIMETAFDSQTTDSMESTVYMALRDKNGNMNTRKLRVYTKQTKNGTNTFIEFLHPADVKGTKFLTIGNKNSTDDQRIYLPELKKVRKIAAASKKQKFMGSDLTYYDMENRDVNDNTYTILRTDSYSLTKDGKEITSECWVIESLPKDNSAPYSKSILWVSKDDTFIYKSEMYNNKENKEKTIYITEVKIIQGILIPVKTLVANVHGHKTLMRIDNIKLNTDIPDTIFTIQNLEKGGY